MPRSPRPVAAAPTRTRNVRRRCVREGFERALAGKQRETPPVPKLLDGRQEAEIIAPRLGPPPESYAQWSLRLLARCVVERGIVDSISHETVSQTPKKRHSRTQARVTGSSPRKPTPSSPRPWKGSWKPMPGRTTRSARVTLVCDTPNTHTQGAFYKAFEPPRARVRRLEFRYTPKHGNWLNVAESALTRQCMRGRRIGDLEELRRETGAWATDVNERQRGVDWQITVADARCTLKSVYPQIVA